ncbi:hypothetical protein NO932_00100 [Pelagibacterium sp. 26DY04]|uniref:hypothetical protein n=1 Tax=Pelagibacterium sp. 26DY04 TaxID=2967130 RepID=UPI002814C66B|nr:hypothetical protein [Pelagibacterium sp. 26DY04]WMT87040.1 hypothetical protein NO932_00100 [Pelagibacterium sp. 26DY04]
MISDTLFKAETEIRQYQRDQPEVYDRLKPKLDALRAHMIAVRLELDQYPGDPPEWLACSPYYVAALAGDPGPSDAYMDGDDSLRKAWLDEIAKLRRNTEL